MKEQNKALKAYVLLAFVYCLVTLAYLMRHGVTLSATADKLLMAAMILVFLALAAFSLYIWRVRPFAPVGWVKVVLFISSVLTAVIVLSEGVLV